jgi:hypothetical protein
MEETVRLRSVHNSWPEWFLIHCITEAEKEGIVKVPSIPEGGLKVTLMINGVQCPVMDTLKYLEKRMDEIIHDRAETLIKNKVGDLGEIFHQIESAVKDKMESLGFSMTNGDY